MGGSCNSLKFRIEARSFTLAFLPLLMLLLRVDWTKEYRRERTAKPFRTLELNLLFNRWVAVCSRRNIEAGFYGKSSTWKIAPKAALASRNSSVGSIIIASGYELRSKNLSPVEQFNTRIENGELGIEIVHSPFSTLNSPFSILPVERFPYV